jgi:hypothetical protein
MTRTAFNEHGKWTNTVYLGTNGLPVLTMKGYASTTAKWDEQGRQIEWACFDPNGQPVLDPADNTHLWRKTFGTGTNWLLFAYYDCQDHLTQPKDGFPKITRKFDARGHQVEWACFGTNDEPILDPRDGSHLTRTAYNERGQWTNVVYLGTNSLPVLTKKGYASTTAKWDEQGNQFEWACFGTNGEPILDPRDGSYLTHTAFNGHGKWTNTVYLGTNGLPVLTKKGYASTTAKWDTRNNLLEQAYFGTNGEPVACRDGYQRRVITYDADGKIVSDQKFGPDGKLLPQPQTP